MPGVLEIDFTKVKRKIRSAPGSAKTSPTLPRKGTVAKISSNCPDKCVRKSLIKQAFKIYLNFQWSITYFSSVKIEDLMSTPPK